MHQLTFQVWNFLGAHWSEVVLRHEVLQCYFFISVHSSKNRFCDWALKFLLSVETKCITEFRSSGTILWFDSI